MCQKYCILTWNMAFEILDNVLELQVFTILKS